MAITFFKFGADVKHIRESAGVGDGFGGYYIFSTVADFLSGAPAEYLQSFGSSHTRLTATRYAGFFQGHWNLSHSLTLDAGVRCEFEQLPSIVRENATNFAPRVGLAFSPSHK